MTFDVLGAEYASLTCKDNQLGYDSLKEAIRVQGFLEQDMSISVFRSRITTVC